MSHFRGLATKSNEFQSYRFNHLLSMSGDRNEETELSTSS